MPSAEEKTYLFKVMPEKKTDFLTRDVDLLVSKIKENLRLTAGFKAKSTVLSKNRASPYIVNTRKERRLVDGDFRERIASKNGKNNDDPYETLRELLQQGRLINEAVKKLKTMNFDELSDDECRDVDDDDDDEFVSHRGYRRKTYYYDSEDEPLPTVYDEDI